MRAKVPFSGGAFSAFLNVGNAINIPSTGTHMLQLYTFIHCGIDQCEGSTDSISIKIKENTEFREIFNTGYKNGRIKDKQWIKETAFFETQSTQIFVNIYLLFD